MPCVQSEKSLEQLDRYPHEPEVHKYLHSRLMELDIATLYELHYLMITMGKVLCSKRLPNCDACPLSDVCEYALNGGPRLMVVGGSWCEDVTACAGLDGSCYHCLL